MKELNLEQLENLEGGKMFGKTCSSGTIGIGKCIDTCTSHFFWFRTRTTTNEYNC